MSNTRKAGAAEGLGNNETHGAENPAPEAGMSRDVINIPDNVLQAGIREYNEADQDDLQWLFSWAGQEVGSRDRLCKLLESDWTTVIRVASGKYPAGIDNFMEKVRDLRRRVEESGQETGFVDTVVTRKIWDTLDYAMAGDVDGGKIVLISGSSRRGKTYAIQEWARRNNHGRSVYVDCPESGGLRALMLEIADACRINKGRKTSDLRDRIFASFNRRRILIVDEIARLIPSGRQAKTTELDFLRRLHDVRGCSIALCATPVFEHMMGDSRLRDYLEQLIGRIAEPLYIPDRVYKSEIRDICKAFAGVPQDRLVDLAHRIANEPGKLGILYELLRQAKALAKAKKTRLAEAHLAAAYRRRKDRFSWPEEDK